VDESAQQLPLFAGPAGSEAEIAKRYRGFAELLAPLGAPPDRVVLTPRYAWQLRVGGTQNGILNIELGRDGAETVEQRLARFVAAYPESLARLPQRGAAEQAYVDLRYPNGFALRVAGWKG
jgi:cell division protein FtsQ